MMKNFVLCLLAWQALNCFAIGSVKNGRQVAVSSPIVLAVHYDYVEGKGWRKRSEALEDMSLDRLTGKEGRIRNDMKIECCALTVLCVTMVCIYLRFLWSVRHESDWSEVNDSFLKSMRCKVFSPIKQESIPRRLRRYFTSNGEVRVLALFTTVCTLILLAFCNDLMVLGKIRRLKVKRANQEEKIKEDIKSIPLQEFPYDDMNPSISNVEGRLWRRILMNMQKNSQ